MISLKNILFGKEKDISDEFLELETKLSVALEEFLSDNNPKKLDQIIPKIKKILTDRFLETNREQIVYRGISLSTKDFKKLFWHKLNDKQKTLFYKIEDGLVNPNDFEKIENFKLKPKSTKWIQSWTSKKDIALSFAGADSITVLCVAKTKKPNLFFGKPGELAKIIEKGFPEEKETISIGQVACTVYFGPTVANQGIQKQLKSKIFSDK